METKHENRFLFLKFFTQELITNTKPGIVIIKPQEETEFPSITNQIPQQKILPPPALIRTRAMPIQQRIMPRFKPRINIQPQLIPSQFPISEIVQPDLNQPLPGFALGKVDNLFKDPTVNMVECPGPGKLILVRSLGNIKATKISLNEQEIKEIIESFAEQTRIPIMTGIFKAAVGNLLITAIISEFVGSRFIITKRIG